MCIIYFGVQILLVSIAEYIKLIVLKENRVKKVKLTFSLILFSIFIGLYNYLIMSQL